MLLLYIDIRCSTVCLKWTDLWRLHYFSIWKSTCNGILVFNVKFSIRRHELKGLNTLLFSLNERNNDEDEIRLAPSFNDFKQKLLSTISLPREPAYRIPGSKGLSYITPLKVGLRTKISHLVPDLAFHQLVDKQLALECLLTPFLMPQGYLYFHQL